MKISVFAETKNEAQFIGYSIMSALPWVDEIVYFDGNSTDGTVQLIKYIQGKYDVDKKIKLFENKDCVDLKDDYVRLVNETIRSCSGDWVMHLHPDMILTNGELLNEEFNSARFDWGLNVMVDSYAADNTLITGRGRTWCLGFRNTRGLEFRGYYGSRAEGFYFKEFGSETSDMFDWKCPYPLYSSRLLVNHLCEMKPHKRRLEKMVNVLENQLPGKPLEKRIDIANNHPRVDLDKMDGRVTEFGVFGKKRTDKCAFDKYLIYKDEFEQFYIPQGGIEQ